MKKYLMIFILEFIFVLSSCDKNNNGQELEFNDIDISVKSNFTDTNLTINLNASDLEDGDNYYNYFHCQKSLNELKDTLNKNEYYVENGDIIRFFKDDSYFFLEYCRRM